MHRVQTLTYFGLPSTIARTRWRLGSQRRLLTLWAWEILLPLIGPLPQISHRCAIVEILLEIPTRGLNLIAQTALFCKCRDHSFLGKSSISESSVVPIRCIDWEYFVPERRFLTLDLSAVALGIDSPIRGLEGGREFPV
jgi:hypothetical protein